MVGTSAAPLAGPAATVVRGFRPDDAPAILSEMLAALERGEYEGMERYQLEHAAERLAPDPASSAVAVVSGRVAGWVIPADDDLHVVPECRRQGVGRLLVEAGRRVAAAQGHERLRLWVPRRPGAEAFARACGLAHTSSLWQMRLPAAGMEALAEPEFPPGAAVRPFRLGIDEGPFVALVNRIFLDHPSPIALREEEVRRVHATPGFDPSTILIVEDAASGAMVGFCRAHPFTAADGTPAGEIRLLGVDRPWRGRGLGRAVTAWGVAELRRRGARFVLLAVEGANERAFSLYTDLGFGLGVEWPHWTAAALADA